MWPRVIWGHLIIVPLGFRHEQHQHGGRVNLNDVKNTSTLCRQLKLENCTNVITVHWGRRVALGNNNMATVRRTVVTRCVKYQMLHVANNRSGIKMYSFQSFGALKRASRRRELLWIRCVADGNTSTNTQTALSSMVHRVSLATGS
jgi:hypothetical protein